MKLAIRLLCALLLLLVAADQAAAQGSTTWAQSILSSPVVSPPNPTDTIGFVHNGKSAQAPVSTFGGGGGGGLSGMTPGQVPIAATANTVTSSQATATTGNSVLVQTDSTGHLLPPINSPSGVFGTAQVTGAPSGSCTFGVAFDSAGNLVKIGCPATGLSGPGSTTVGFAPLWGNTTGTSLGVGLPVSAVAAPNTIPETGSGNTLAPAFLPTPTASTLGGVQSFTSPAHQWINQISTAGVPSAAQPAFADISGTLAAAQCPLGSTSAIGCLQVGTGLNVSAGVIQLGQISSVTNQWVDSVSGLGVAHLSQPAFSNLSGQATFAQFPSITGPTILGRVTNTLGTPSAAYTPSNATDTTVPLIHGPTVINDCPKFSDTTGTMVDAACGGGGGGALTVTDGTTTVTGTTQITFGTGLKVGGSSPNATLGFANIGSFVSGSFHLLGNPTGSSAIPIDTTLSVSSPLGVTCASTTCTETVATATTSSLGVATSDNVSTTVTGAGKIADIPATYHAVTANCTINQSGTGAAGCSGTTNDQTYVLTPTAASVVITMGVTPTVGGPLQSFGYDGSHSYTIATGSASIYNCGPTVTSLTGINYPLQLIPDGTNWQCAPSSPPNVAGNLGPADTTQPGPTYSFGPLDCNTTVHFTGITTATVPSTLSPNCDIAVVQDVAGNQGVTFAAGAGMTQHSAGGLIHTNTQNSFAGIHVYTGGNYYLIGDRS